MRRRRRPPVTIPPPVAVPDANPSEPIASSPAPCMAEDRLDVDRDRQREADLHADHRQRLEHRVAEHVRRSTRSVPAPFACAVRTYGASSTSTIAPRSIRT